MKSCSIVLLSFSLTLEVFDVSGRYLLVDIDDDKRWTAQKWMAVNGTVIEEGVPENDEADGQIGPSARIFGKCCFFGRCIEWLPVCPWFCFEENTRVWTKAESQADEEAEQIPIKHLKEGNLVRTMTPELLAGKVQDVMEWTRATDVTIINGDWMVHKFIFDTGDHLTVTSQHMMIIWPNNLPHFVRADEVKIGDMMRVHQTLEKITEIKTFMVDVKVSVETEDGTLQANDVLTSGFCDHNPDMLNKTMEVFRALRTYKDQHFTPCYNNMCMDSVAWNNSFMLNNGLLPMDHTQY